MALLKSKVLPNGTIGNYWKITKCEYDRITHICTWTISLFTNAECGSRGAHLGVQKTFRKKLTPEEAKANRSALGYETIKAQAAQLVPSFGYGEPILRDADLAGAIDS